MLNNFYPHVININFHDMDRTKFIGYIKTQLLTTPDDKTILLMAYEWQSVDDLVEMMKNINGNKKMIWLLNESFYSDDQKKTLISTNADVRFIEFDLLVLDFELNLFKTSSLNQNWNPDCKRFLFLTGKPNRSNRIRLLYKFYKSGLLDQCTWSFFIDQNLKQQCRKFMLDLDDNEYDSFLSKVAHNPDGVDILWGSGGSCHYDGYPFNKELYSNCSFRVISETQMMEAPIISEKTWVTIANRLPFILSGYRNNLELLQRQGFRTFERYLKITYYDDIDDEEQRLNSVVENTEFWLANIEKNRDEIQEDIDYNYHLLSQKILETRQNFLEIYDALDDARYEIFRIIPIPIQKCQWINFYYGIKDPSWPDCWSPAGFSTLPEYIQQEMIDIYGYKN